MTLTSLPGSSPELPDLGAQITARFTGTPGVTALRLVQDRFQAGMQPSLGLPLLDVIHRRWSNGESWGQHGSNDLPFVVAPRPAPASGAASPPPIAANPLLAKDIRLASLMSGSATTDVQPPTQSAEITPPVATALTASDAAEFPGPGVTQSSAPSALAQRTSSAVDSQLLPEARHAIDSLRGPAMPAAPRAAGVAETSVSEPGASLALAQRASSPIGSPPLPEAQHAIDSPRSPAMAAARQTIHIAETSVSQPGASLTIAQRAPSLAGSQPLPQAQHVVDNPRDPAMPVASHAAGVAETSASEQRADLTLAQRASSPADLPPLPEARHAIDSPRGPTVSAASHAAVVAKAEASQPGAALALAQSDTGGPRGSAYLEQASQTFAPRVLRDQSSVVVHQPSSEMAHSSPHELRSAIATPALFPGNVSPALLLPSMIGGKAPTAQVMSKATMPPTLSNAPALPASPLAPDAHLKPAASSSPSRQSGPDLVLSFAPVSTGMVAAGWASPALQTAVALAAPGVQPLGAPPGDFPLAAPGLVLARQGATTQTEAARLQRATDTESGGASESMSPAGPAASAVTAPSAHAEMAPPSRPEIDLERLTDQVYFMLERRLTVERERLGL